MSSFICGTGYYGERITALLKIVPLILNGFNFFLFLLWLGSWCLPHTNYMGLVVPRLLWFEGCLRRFNELKSKTLLLCSQQALHILFPILHRRFILKPLQFGNSLLLVSNNPNNRPLLCSCSTSLQCLSSVNKRTVGLSKTMLVKWVSDVTNCAITIRVIWFELFHVWILKSTLCSQQSQMILLIVIWSCDSKLVIRLTHSPIYEP